jgi:acetyltransferase-like isoleucine patch superfamily enzyme
MSVWYRLPVVRGAIVATQSALVAVQLGCSVGRGVRAFGLPILGIAHGSSVCIGDNLMLISDSYFSEPGVPHPCVIRTLSPHASLRIGDNAGLSGCTICAAESITIGNEVLMGAGAAVVDTDFHPLAACGRRWTRQGVGTAPVVLGDNVFLGMGVLVLKGVTIGDDAVIAAGSIVTSDIPAGVVAAGAPARPVSDVPEATGDATP